MCLFNCKNSRFIILFSLFIFIRKTILLLLKHLCSFEGTLITSWIMFGAELFIGLYNIYIEYKKLINDKVEKFLGIPLIYNEQEPYNGKCIKVLLFLFCALLDFGNCFFLNYHVNNKYNEILFLLDSKLSPIQILFTSIICSFILSQKIYLNQFISLLLILISLAGIISTEFLLRQKIDNIDKLIKLFIFIIGCYLFTGLQNCIEKFLMKYDNSTPFQILFYEGIFGNIFMIIISFFNFQNIFSTKNEINNQWILIIGLILYFFSCCFLNIYRLSLINDSSPTNVTTCESFVIPFILLFSFFDSYKNNIDKYWLYTLVNFGAIFIIIIGCLFFNEIIILNCGKDYDDRNSSIRINKTEESEENSQHKLDGSFTSEGDDSF